MLWMLPVAHAHVGAMLEAVDMVLPGPAVAATFGLVVREDDGAHRWICHEAITAVNAVVTPRYARSSSGTWLGVVPVLEQVRDPGITVYRSEDGCDWLPVEGMSEQVVTRVAFAPDDPERAIAVSANLADGISSGVFLSTDGGQQFVEQLSASERLFRSLRYSTGVSGQVFATAVWYEGGTGWIYSSTDGGETWAEYPSPNPDNLKLFDVDVVAVSPTEPETAWFVVGPYGGDTVYKTTDGGQTMIPVLENVSGDIIDGAADAQGGIWLVASSSRMFYAADGESFSEIPSPPGGIGIGVDGETVYPTGLAQLTTLMYARTDDQGVTFTDDVFLEDIQAPPSCPEGSDVAEICDPLWPKLEGRLPTQGVDTGEPPDDPDEPEGDTGSLEEPDTCGCGGADSGLAAVCLLLWFGRRRRR